MKLVDLKCPHCGAVLTVNSDLNECTCTYCGTKVLVDDEVQKVVHSIDKPFETAYAMRSGELQADMDFDFNNKYSAFLSVLSNNIVLDIDFVKQYFNDYLIEGKLEIKPEVIIKHGCIMLRKDFNTLKGKIALARAIRVKHYSKLKWFIFGGLALGLFIMIKLSFGIGFAIVLLCILFARF